MPSTDKSVISLSMHKAGSSIADRIITDFCVEKGMEIDRIALSVPSSPLSEPEIFINYQKKMALEGTYYGIARGAYVSEMQIIDKLKLIVQLRDPRDCLTSAYFSFKISHRLPDDPEKRKAFMERQKKLEGTDIDSYVSSNTGGYRNRMAVLREIVSRNDDVLVLKYEDMVEKTEKWLSQISEFLDQPIFPSLRDAIEPKINPFIPLAHV